MQTDYNSKLFDLIPDPDILRSVEESTSGIVLKVFNYKENERIITLFSKDQGIISLLIKRAREHVALATPFCEAEFHYKRGKSDLFRFYDGSIIDLHLALRSEISRLRAAGAMAKALLSSQMPGKPAPKLYELFSLSLKKIPFQDPDMLVIFFNLKLLTHEGSICWEEPHRFPLSVTEEQWSSLKRLALCRSFQGVTKIFLEEEVKEKIRTCHHV